MFVRRQKVKRELRSLCRSITLSYTPAAVCVRPLRVFSLVDRRQADSPYGLGTTGPARGIRWPLTASIWQGRCDCIYRDTIKNIRFNLWCDTGFPSCFVWTVRSQNFAPSRLTSQYWQIWVGDNTLRILFLFFPCMCTINFPLSPTQK